MGDADTDRLEHWAGCLRVGVTGHRPVRLEGVDLAALGDGVCAVLKHIQQALPGNHQPCLVSSLADGADSIAADAALAIGWRIDVVLPLPRDDYARDFADGGALHRRLGQAATIFELPVAMPGNDDARAAAYERAGRVMLAQSDLLLAIWDGEPAQGRGGAAQILEEAVREGVPVIHVDPLAPDIAELLWTGFEGHGFGDPTIEAVPRGGLDRLPEVVARLTRRAPDRLADALIAEAERPRAIPRRWFAFAYPALLTVTRANGVRRAPPVGPDESAPEPTAVNTRLTRWFAGADAGAVAAAQTFRSAYVTNYALAALAVLIALSGLALPGSIKPALAFLELAAIGAILALLHAGRRANWHRRWLDQRQLAERLRCLVVAHRLGELGLRRDLASGDHWVGWAMRAAGRMAGLPAARIDAAYLTAVRAELIALLDGQLRYLDADAARMHRLDHRLHRLGVALFVATALACVAVVAVKLSGLFLPGAWSAGTLDAISVAATISAAGLPACGAALYGMRMQGDFGGASARAATLAAQVRALHALAVGDPLDFDPLWRRTRQATELLTDSLTTWLHAYSARPLTLPG